MGEAVVSMRGGDVSTALEVSFTGKIAEVRQSDKGMFYATVLVPGPDAFSSAVPFEVRSERNIGREDEIVSLKCRVGGFFKKQYKMDEVDPRTGEVLRDRHGRVQQRIVRPIVNTLDVIH